jgi:hypothetical protein
MRFLTAVALAAVMLWVPVDASGQEVTIEAVEMTTPQGSEYYGYSQSIKFRSRNNTSRPIVAWRGDLRISNPFGELIWDSTECVGHFDTRGTPITSHCEPLLFGGESDLSPNGTDEQYQRLWYRGNGMDGYEVKDLTFLWTNLRVAY